ncbi:Transmembrane 9 superfamily member 3 [Tritrichomonas musculus]|uniref:Transmembrane 9 superfamily member n=1 Tax=Tritrichomonas musculus TaxID=1915356 RepID=A0ABR2K371_9EUKA
MILLFLLCFISFSRSYQKNDIIIAYANKIGPENDPIESYSPDYFFLNQLGVNRKNSKKSIDDMFFGNNFQDVGFHMAFQKNYQNHFFTEITLTSEKIDVLDRIIRNDYLVQLSIDDLPCWYHIGSFIDGTSQIYQKINFEIHYNNFKIIEAKASSANLTSLTISSPITMSYSVTWKKTDRKYSDRLQLYSNDEFFKNSIHKYALINSGLLCFLLILLVALLFNNIMSRDYNHLAQEAAFDGFEVEINTEKGWKALHGDVFRPPKHLSFLSMICGSGVHFFIFFILFSVLYSKGNSSPFSFGLLIYTITAPFSGFAAVTFGRVFEVTKWLRLAFGSAFITPTGYILMLIFRWLISKGSGLSYSISLYYLIILLFLFIIIIVPLNGLGGYIAIKLKLFEMSKCEVSLVPRQITRLPFYLNSLFLEAVTGLVCTSSIIIEVYYMLSGMFHTVGNYLWSYLVISLIIFTIVVGCSSILSNYLILQSENHHWQWPAFIAPASTGFYVFLYSIYYLITKTNIHGISLIILYFVYTSCFSLALALLAGGIGYSACNVFVHKIFANLKLD